jgi:Ca-activated chloride channel family protein
MATDRPIGRAMLAAAAVAIAAATSVSLSGSSQQFRSTTEVVVVDVLVTRDRKPVEGLNVEDFVVRDAGVRQSVALLSVEAVPVDLHLVLDVSASLQGDGIEQLKQAARAAVASLRPEDRAELLTFSDDLNVRAPWSRDRAAMNKAIDAVTANGWTSLVDATFTALSLSEDPNRRRLVLIFTDGQDTSSWLSAADVFRSAARSRVTICGVIAAPAPLNRPDLQAPARLRDLMLSDPLSYRSAFLPVMTHETGGELLWVSLTNDLRKAFLDVVSRFNRRYLLSYTPTGVAESGWHPIEVTVKDKTLEVTARRGYQR